MNVTRLGVAIGSNVNREKVRRKLRRDALEGGCTPHTTSTVDLQATISKAGDESIQHRPEGGCPTSGSLPMTNLDTRA